MCGFNLKTLENVVANPFDPPNPADPFGSNIHVMNNPIPAPGAGDLGTSGSGDQRNTTGGSLNGNGSSADSGLPSDRNFGTETTNTLSSLLGMAPGLLAAYQKYNPQFNQSNITTLGQGLFGSGFTGNLGQINSGLTDLSNSQTNSSNTSLRTSNQSDIANLGPGALAQMQKLNPGLYAGLASQSAAAGQGLNSVTTGPISAPGSNSTLDSLMLRSQGTGQDSLLAQQNQLASSQLALGGQLTPDQLRSVQQSSRAGFAARGLDGTNASVVDEAMQTQGAQQAMLQQRLAQAGNVEGLNQQSTQLQNTLGLGASSQALGYGQLGTAAQQAQGNLTLGTSAQNAALQGQGFNQGQAAFGNYAGTAFNPYSTILGQSTSNAGNNQSLFGDAASQSSASGQTLSNYLNPMNSYASDVYNTNYNAAAAQNIANINAKAGVSAGSTQALGSAASAAIPAMMMMCCWVAREVFGTNDNRWLMFRHWLLEYSPRWFLWAYLRFGERFARWVHHHPRVKARIRIWMESKISTLYPHAV